MVNTLTKFLILVGKPFYRILEAVIIAIASLIYFPRRLKVRLPKFSLKRSKKIKKIKIKIRRVKAKKTKIFTFKVPKLIFPDIKKPINLLFLKIKLLLLKLKPKRKLKVHKLNLKLVIALIVAAASAGWFYLSIVKDLPSPRELLDRNLEVSTKIYDRNGVLLYKIYKNQNRTPISLSEIPLHVQLATLAAEDAEFYFHPGFSIKGIFRSLIRNIKVGELSGGSTITQQLVKNALLTPEKTLRRKIKEVILAIQVERIFEKSQILEMYLNEVSYGGTAYGIAEASEEYFGKKVSQLSLSEATYLAGLIKSPTKFSPYGVNPDLAILRGREVLHLMKVNKFITEVQEKEAQGENVEIKSKITDIKAPHFVMYVRQILVDKYGEDMVEKGGLEVTTSLDWKIQQMAEAAVKAEIEKLSGLKVGNGAAVVINPKTGEILAMVGSKDYFYPGYGNVNVTVRNRQPGSSIKIVNYAYALANGYSPASIIDDSPTTFVVPGLAPYTPVNYDGSFKGKITLRSALAQSRNIPAVKVLASYGVKKMLELGRKMGITTWSDPSQYGLSLTLGGGEVKLIDLAQVFATVANMGKKPEMVSILKIVNYKGKTVEEDGRGEATEVIDPRIAFMLIDILKDNFARAPEFGLHSALVIPNHPEVAVKTGTSNDLKDNLTVGFNQKYLVAVWVGNNDNSPMSRVASGVTGASPIWNKIMSTLVQNEKSENWTTPSGLVQIPCFGRLEWFLEEVDTRKFCTPPPSPTPTPIGQNTPMPQILEPAIYTVDN